MQSQNKYYWENKEQRAEKAKRHTANMEKKHCYDIAASVKSTIIYSDVDFSNILEECSNSTDEITVKVLSSDSVSAIISEHEGKTAVLNFASYKFSGGGFLEGSQAQEECLCHESFLFNVLKHFQDFYVWNQRHLNNSLYLNRALYSPNIVFEKGGTSVKCDVITCAAPNFSTAKRRSVSRDENDAALRDRIRFILRIAKANKVNTLILGAFGCGVFLQRPETVAKIFDDEIKNIFAGNKIKIVFAIIPPLPNQSDNFTPFKKIFA